RAMAFLVRLEDVSLAYGDQKILVGANLAIEPGERVCLIGRDGAGKSSTLKIIAGRIEPDNGEVHKPNDLRIGMLDQRLSEPSVRSVREVVLEGMDQQRRLIDEFHRLSSTPPPVERATLRRMEELERSIDAGGGWSIETLVEAMISQLQLP